MTSFEAVHRIPNPDQPAYLPDVEFSTSGKIFAVTEKESNRVRIYDSETLEMIHELSGEESGLDAPHGLAMTDKVLIVSSKGSTKTSQTFISSFSLEDHAKAPTSVVNSPDKKLREPHSLAIHESKLFCTYCEGELNGVAVFEFNPQTGEIGACERFVSDCFDGFGQPKGVAVDAENDRLLVSFVSEKEVAANTGNIMAKTERAWKLSKDPIELLGKGFRLAKRQLLSETQPENEVKNGVMIFPLDGGTIRDTPKQIIESTGYTRFENIDVRNNMVAIADPLNNCVELYRLTQTGLGTPELTINEGLNFPHDIAISPSGDSLIVANYGIKTHEGEIMWNCFEEPRTDQLVIFRQQ